MTVRLETPRLILRDHEPRDLEPHCTIESDPEYRWPQVVHPRETIERGFQTMLGPKPLGLWAVETREAGRYIGRIGLYPYRTDDNEIVPGELNIGFYVARAEWGRGYATEAGRALIAFGFGPLGARRIHAGAHRENARSLRVIEKLGFTRVVPRAPTGSPAIDFVLEHPAP